MGELVEVIVDVDCNEKVCCIVLIGSEKVFVVGVDIKEMFEKFFVQVMIENIFSVEIDCIILVCKFIIVVVLGYVLGGGCELVMVCDFIICVDIVKFGQFEINLGVIVGIGGMQCLMCFVGKLKLMDMYLIGCFMDVVEVECLGLVSCVVFVVKLIFEIMVIVCKIVEKLLIVIVVVKEVVNCVYEIMLVEGILFECCSFQVLFVIEDQKEGMNVFLEKCEVQFCDC